MSHEDDGRHEKWNDRDYTDPLAKERKKRNRRSERNGSYPRSNDVGLVIKRSGRLVLHDIPRDVSVHIRDIPVVWGLAPTFIGFASRPPPHCPHRNHLRERTL
jgi:hypothetical protein